MDANFLFSRQFRFLVILWAIITKCGVILIKSQEKREKERLTYTIYPRNIVHAILVKLYCTYSNSNQWLYVVETRDVCWNIVKSFRHFLTSALKLKQKSQIIKIRFIDCKITQLPMYHEIDQLYIIRFLAPNGGCAATEGEIRSYMELFSHSGLCVILYIFYV